MKYSDLFVYVLSEAAGCPEFTAERAIRDTCIDFCARTDIYRAEPQTLVIVPGVTEYELDAPSGTEPNHVMKVYRQGRELASITFDEAFPLNESTTRTAPSAFCQSDNKTLIVAPTPDAKETLKVLYSLKPLATSTSIPDTIGLENREVLVSGALFRLQMMAGMPWTNGGAASTNAQIYERGVTKVIRQAKYGHNGASMTVTPREFI